MRIPEPVNHLYHTNRQIIFFLIIGILCYFIGIGQLILFVEWLKFEVNLANVVSSLITIFICYSLNVNFVFKGGRHSKVGEITVFYVFSFLGFLLNVGLMFLLTKYVPLWYVISKSIVTLVVAAFNFTVRKKFVFLK